MKMYRGKDPDTEAGEWVKIGLAQHEGLNWGVFMKGQSHSDEWSTFKVCADGRAERKANYWVTKNMKTGQIGYPRDWAIMRDTRPELHGKVENIISEFMR